MGGFILLDHSRLPVAYRGVRVNSFIAHIAAQHMEVGAISLHNPFYDTGSSY
jgi:hypothetical protein